MTYRYPGSAYQQRIERLGEKGLQADVRRNRKGRYKLPSREDVIAAMKPGIKARIDAIVARECDKAGITRDDIMAKALSRTAVRITRQRIFHILSTEMKLTDLQIGALFERRADVVRGSIEIYLSNT